MPFLRRLANSIASFFRPRVAKEQAVQTIARSQARSNQYSTPRNAIQSQTYSIGQKRKRGSSSPQPTPRKSARKTPQASIPRYDYDDEDVDMIDTEEDEQLSPTLLNSYQGDDEQDSESEANGVSSPLSGNHYSEELVSNNSEYETEAEDEYTEDPVSNAGRSAKSSKTSHTNFDSIEDTYIEAEDENSSQFNDEQPAKLDTKSIKPLSADTTSSPVDRESLLAANWPEDHIFLVERLQRRGREPILPLSWKMALRYMPANLFIDDEEAFLASQRATAFSGEHKFNLLLDLCIRMRCSAAAPDQRPEKHVVNIVKAHMKWAMRDVGLRVEKVRPIFRVITAPGNMAPEEVSERATDAMKRLYNKYWALMDRGAQEEEGEDARHSPVLYGLVVSHLTVALVALREPTVREVQPIAFFDFGDPDLDVWNAIALFIIMRHVRNIQQRFALEENVAEDAMSVKDEYDPDR